MRSFSDFEKNLIRKIIEREQSDNLLKPHSFLKGLLNIQSQVMFVGRAPNYQLKEGETHYYKIEIKGHENYINDDYFEITNRLYETNELLNFLIRDGYLLRHEGGDMAGLIINLRDEFFKEDIKDIKTIEVYINTPLKELLDKCSYYYKATESLRDLVKHKFKFKEERNNRTTRIISIVSISITVLGLITNYYLNKSKDSLPKPQTITIDTISINRIIQGVQYPNIKLDTSSINYLINKLSKKNKTAVDTVKEKKGINTKPKTNN